LLQRGNARAFPNSTLLVVPVGQGQAEGVMLYLLP
jgi:hypothetical protein